MITDPSSNMKGKQEQEHWYAFVLPWDDISDSVTDMSHLLHKPAGATGFIHIKDGHLASGDGKRWRFWGVGQVFSAWVPPMEIAGVIARRMAKFGINCLRLHHLDHRWPSGILKRYNSGKSGPGNTPPGRYAHPGLDSTREFDPEAMARLDWFVACCKENGIYIDFNLNVTRRFSLGDGVKDPELLGYSKGITYFDDRIIFLQKEYARNLLNHVNPFTGNRYADEPAVAMIEILNENSLIASWLRGNLQGRKTYPDQTWRDIPPSYARDLDLRWNTWLARRYADRSAISDAWNGDLRPYEDAAAKTVRRLPPDGFSSASVGRFRDEARFYVEIEQSFFQDMTTFLRGEVGVKQLIVPTSDWDHSWSALPALETYAKMDVVDGHAYWDAPWQHPLTTSHKAQVDNPDSSLPAILSRSIIKNKPYIVSEINESFPNDFMAECIPLCAAYALLQDWDGFFWHSYTGGHFGWNEIWQEQAIKHHLRISTDPVRMSQMAIGSLMFLRGDIQSARQLIERTLPYDWGLDSLRIKAEDNSHLYWLPYLSQRVSLVHRIALSNFHAAAVLPAEGEVSLPEGRITSDTGELIWEDTPGDGRVLIDAPRHQGVIMRSGSRSTTNLAITLDTPFAAIQAASLDDAPISRTRRLLLVAVSRVANTGMRWNEDRSSVYGSVGSAPTCIEPVQATITLKGLEGVKSVSLQPLDGCGKPLGEAQQVVECEHGWTLRLTGVPTTTWYEVLITR